MSRSDAEIRFVAIAVALSVLLVGAVWCVDYLPTNDGPQHVFLGYASRHIDDIDKGYGRYLEPNPALTGVGFDALYGVFLIFLPWRPAVSLVLTVMTLLWAWGVVALATSLGGRRRWLGLLGFATAFCWPLYMGLFSYYLATAIGFWILAFTFRVEIRTARHWFILGAALLAQVFCHVFAAALTGATVALICLWQAPSASERWRTLGRLALAGAPAASMVLLTVGGHTSHGGSSWSFLQRLTFVGRCFVSGPGWRCWPVVALAAAGLGVTIARGQWRRDPRQAVPLLVGALALVIAVVAPLHLPTWQFFSPRLLPFAVILLALLFPADRAGPAAAAVLTTYATACVLWAGWYHRDLRSKTADALAALDLPLHRSRFRLDLSLSLAPGAWGFLDRAVPFATPMFNIGPLYAVAHGGVTTAIFGGDPTAHALLWRKTLDQPAPPIPPLGS